MIFTITVTVRPIFKPTRTACIIMSAMFATFPGFPVRFSNCLQVCVATPLQFHRNTAGKNLSSPNFKKIFRRSKKASKIKASGAKKNFLSGRFQNRIRTRSGKKTTGNGADSSHTGAHARTYAHAHGRLRLHTPARIHPHICLHARAYLRMLARIRLHLHTWALTCTLTHTHAWERIHGHGRKKGMPAEQITPRLRNGQEQTGTDRGSK